MDEQLKQLDTLYDLPWNRIGPYLVGVITAYILLHNLKWKLILKQRTRIMLWIIFPLLNLWILFTLYTKQMSVEFAAIYTGIARTLWGVGLAWLLIACCTDNAPPLKRFLSFKGWIFFSRLTYCAYLLNPLVVNIIRMGATSSFNASLSNMGVSIAGFTFLTFMLSFVLFLLVESPCVLLTRKLMKF